MKKKELVAKLIELERRIADLELKEHLTQKTITEWFRVTGNRAIDRRGGRISFAALKQLVPVKMKSRLEKYLEDSPKYKLEYRVKGYSVVKL